MHSERVSQEELLDRQLPEDAQLLLDAYKLEGVLTRDIDRGGDEGESCESAADLVYLHEENR
jgi:hypothetical protein